MEGLIDRRFDISGTESLKAQIKTQFGKKVLSIRTQCDMFDGFDEMSVLLEGNEVYACLVQKGVQISDWKYIPPPEVKNR